MLSGKGLLVKYKKVNVMSKMKNIHEVVARSRLQVSVTVQCMKLKSCTGLLLS